MECLAAGRGICLPATALASSNVATYGILNYAKHRRQFNIPLIKMEGIQSKFVDIIFNTGFNWYQINRHNFRYGRKTCCYFGNNETTTCR